MTVPVLSRLQHMLDAAGHVEQLIRGKTISDIEQDHVASAALERFIEIISEASRHIPEAVKARHPEIPWPDVAAIGNILRHVYDQVDLRVLWATAIDDLPTLVEGVSAMAATLRASDP